MRRLIASAFVVGTVAALCSPARTPAVSPPATPTAAAIPRSLIARPLVFEENRGQSAPEVRFVARGGAATAFVTDRDAAFATRWGAVRVRPVVAGAPSDARASGEDELAGRANYFIGRDPSRWRTGVPMFARVRCAGVGPGIDVVWHGCGAGLEYDFVVAPGADASCAAVEFDGADDVRVDDAGDVVVRRGDATLRQRAPVVYEEDGRPLRARCVKDGPRRVRFDVAGRDATKTLVIDPVVYASYLGGDDPAHGLERVLAMTKDGAGNTYVAGGTTSADFPLVNAAQDTFGGTGQFARGDEFVTKLDPTGHTILYSTYLGGDQDDEAHGVGVDAAGNAYVGGEVYSTNFPTTTGAFQETYGISGDGNVTKLSPAGDTIVWSTFTGGRASGVLDLVADAAGHAYCVGGAYEGFATTPGAPQPTNLGGEDAIVFEMALDGASMVYATYLGGSSYDRGIGIAVTPSGEVCVTGYANSNDFNVHGFGAEDPAQTTYGGGPLDAFVARVNATGTAFVFSTYLGGRYDEYASKPAFDAAGNVFVPGYTSSDDFPTLSPAQTDLGGGRDAYLVSYDPQGHVRFATYLGGTQDEIGYAVAVQSTGAIWMTGYTMSTDLPVVNALKSELGGTSDGFLAHIAGTGGAFDQVTYVGGTGEDEAYALTLDAAGDPLLAGTTSSEDLPVTPGAAQTVIGGGYYDGLISSLPAPPAITSFFLPKKVIAKRNAKTPAKSTLTANGIFDTGPDAPDFASAAKLDVGGLHFDIPGLVQQDSVFAYAGDGVSFSIEPNPYGSSRAKFKLKYTGDFAGQVDPDGPLDLYFENAVTEGGGSVELGRGVFGLGKVRGALVKPNLFVVRAHAVFKGPGKDALIVIVGLATAGTTPVSASDLAIGFGSEVSQVVPGASFKRQGDTDVFTGKGPGITKAIVDYAREQIAVTAKGLDLSAFTEGGNTVQITVGLGGDQRAVIVRMGRIGNLMKY